MTMSEEKGFKEKLDLILQRLGKLETITEKIFNVLTKDNAFKNEEFEKGCSEKTAFSKEQLEKNSLENEDEEKIISVNEGCEKECLETDLEKDCSGKEKLEQESSEKKKFEKELLKKEEIERECSENECLKNEDFEKLLEQNYPKLEQDELERELEDVIENITNIDNDLPELQFHELELENDYTEQLPEKEYSAQTGFENECSEMDGLENNCSEKTELKECLKLLEKLGEEDLVKVNDRIATLLKEYAEEKRAQHLLEKESSEKVEITKGRKKSGRKNKNKRKK